MGDLVLLYGNDSAYEIFGTWIARINTDKRMCSDTTCFNGFCVRTSVIEFIRWLADIRSTIGDRMSNQQGDVRVLPIAEEFIAGFRECLDSVAHERLYLGLVEAPGLDAVREFVQANIANDLPQFVAVEGDTVVGWCDILPEKLAGFAHCGELGMGVRKAWRGRGIGRRLLQATLDKAREKNLERVELEVYASNQAAVELYKRTGFVVEGEKRKGRKLDGKYDDVVCMALLFE